MAVIIHEGLTNCIARADKKVLEKLESMLSFNNVEACP
jgi:hypothetical protein